MGVTTHICRKAKDTLSLMPMLRHYKAVKVPKVRTFDSCNAAAPFKGITWCLCFYRELASQNRTKSHVAFYDSRSVNSPFQTKM